MRAVVLPSYNRNIIRAMLGLKVQDVKIPIPKADEVLIKMHASPVNPSDIAFIQGIYNVVKTLPAIPGFEASGEVIEAGHEANELIGRKVSCFVQDDLSGTWSEYVIANKVDVIVLKEDMDLDQAACLTVNPFTAWGMFDIALQREARSIIQNAAGSQVAGFIREIANEHDIDVINIVRSKETAQNLMEDGVRYVLVDTDEDFNEKLMEYSANLSPAVAYDAVGGCLSGLMYNALANDSELVVYGGLSGKPLSDLNVMDVIFNNKIVSGFNLMDWKDEIGIEEFNNISDKLQDKFISGIYKTKISDVCSLDNIVVGLRKYIANMSGGKLLIKP